MADRKIMIDTSILIDYFRKTDKSKTKLLHYFKDSSHLHISSITEFEIYNGATEAHKQFWNELLSRITVLNFDSGTAQQAATIVADLKKKRKTIDKPDLFIAATAIVNNLPFDTFNVKHFIHVERLELLDNNFRSLAAGA